MGRGWRLEVEVEADILVVEAVVEGVSVALVCAEAITKME